MCRTVSPCIKTFMTGFDDDPVSVPVPAPAPAPAPVPAPAPALAVDGPESAADVRRAVDRIYAEQAAKSRKPKAEALHTRNAETARAVLARGYTCGIDAARVGKRARAFMLKTTNVLLLSAVRKITEVTDTHVTLGGTRKTLKVPRGDLFVEL